MTIVVLMGALGLGIFVACFWCYQGWDNARKEKWRQQARMNALASYYSPVAANDYSSIH